MLVEPESPFRSHPPDLSPDQHASVECQECTKRCWR
jgi:hypothetical protein